MREFFPLLCFSFLELVEEIGVEFWWNFFDGVDVVVDGSCQFVERAGAVGQFQYCGEVG